MNDKMLLKKLREIERYDAAQVLERLLTEGGSGITNGTTTSPQHDGPASRYLDGRFTWSKIPAFLCSTPSMRIDYWKRVKDDLLDHELSA